MKTLLPLILTALAASPALADNFFVEVVPQPRIEWNEPPAVLQKHNQDGEMDATLYPDIDINYVRTSIPAINATLNREQNETLANASPELEFSAENAAEAAALPTIPSVATFSKWANQFAQAQWSIYEEGDMLRQFSLSSVIHYLGHYKNLELFSLDSHSYLGGAHGIGYSHYYVFNHQGKRLTFADIFISPDKLVDIQPLLKPGMAAYAKENEINLDNAFFDGALDKPTGNENFTFTQDGIKILYQPYEIASYSMGMPYTILPYDKLKGIVKDEYLPNSSGKRL